MYKVNNCFKQFISQNKHQQVFRIETDQDCNHWGLFWMHIIQSSWLRGKFKLDGHLRDTIYSHSTYYTAFCHINNYSDKR